MTESLCVQNGIRHRWGKANRGAAGIAWTEQHLYRQWNITNIKTDPKSKKQTESYGLGATLHK